MLIINRKRRVYLRFLRKTAKSISPHQKGIRVSIKLHDVHGVDLLKSKFIRGRFSERTIIFNGQ